MSTGVVMVEHPGVVLPQIPPLLPDWSHEAPEDLLLHVLIHCLILWEKLEVDDALDVKKRD